MPTSESTPASSAVFLTADDRAVITQRAVKAASELARSHGIHSDDPVILADRYAVRVHLRPAPVVARVSTYTALLRAPIDGWLERELAVSAYLSESGAPVVAPSKHLAPGPHTHDGFGISFWTYEEPVSDEIPGPEVTGRMLGELHAAMRTYPGQLPLLAPPAHDIPFGLQRIERLGLLPAEDLSLLRRVADRLMPIVREPSGPLQPLHGDAHAYNLIPTSRGLLWNDFEDTCLGPIAWDLSTLIDSEGKMLAAYPGAPPKEALVPYQQVRMLQAAAFVYGLMPECNEWKEQARGIVEAIRAMS